MEYDVNERDMDDFIRQKKEYLPSTAEYYKIEPKYKKQVNIIPLSNLLIDYKIESIINILRKTLGSEYFDSKSINTQKVLRLNDKLTHLMIKFMNDQPINPVQVIEVTEINDPSPTNPNRPSVVGLDTVLIKQELGYNDYLYEPIDNPEIVALSVYFKYDYLPVVITI